MLRAVALFAAASSFALAANAGHASLRAGRVAVVIAPDAPKTVQFAAKEMGGLLGQVLGCEIPVRHDFVDGCTAVVLGANAWSEAAGLSIDGLPRDAFRVKATKKRIYIAGADDPAADVEKLVADNNHWALAGCEHATLYGVYDFLERFAGCGFYFPGEIGTVTPRADEVVVPVGDYERAPVFTVRNIYIGQKFDWPGAVTSSSNYALNWLRLRLQTENIPCSHGSRHFRYIERFAKTHPEYLALKKDGSRWDDPKVFAAYQLCWSDPGLRATMYEDVKAYLTGQPAASRGLACWGVNCVRGKYVDIMPDDSFQGCLCPRCQAAYDFSGPKSGYATKLLWGLAAEIGNRLLEEGVPGNITMMAYTPYRTLPDFALPTNVQVMVAENGPWSVPNEGRVKAEADEIAGWADKIGHKVWIWTYPRRGEAVRLPGVPSMAPRAHAAYFKRVAKDIFGSFVESESERFIYHYLNYWMFAKLAWDTDLDVDKALDGHCAKMFGAAAPEMKRFYVELEKKWMQMVGNTVDTPLGPVTKAPTVHEVYASLYSPAVLAEWRKLFDDAEGKVAADAGSLRRVRFMRAQFLEELDRAVSEYDEATSVAKNLAKREGQPDRSVIRGGEFDSLDGWEVEKGTVSATLDRTTFVTPPASVRIVSDKRAGLKIRIPGVLKPNAKYRVSFFLKTENVSPAGGAFVEFGLCRNWLYFPGYGKVPPSGTVDWLYQSYEFTAPPGADADPDAYFHLLLTSAGTAWYDGLRVEEVE